MTRDRIYRLIDAERERQEQKFGGPHAHGSGSCASAGVPLAVKVAVLSEECGEVARAFLDGNAAGLRDELIQVAAVAVAIIEGEES